MRQLHGDQEGENINACLSNSICTLGYFNVSIKFTTIHFSL